MLFWEDAVLWNFQSDARTGAQAVLIYWPRRHTNLTICFALLGTITWKETRRIDCNVHMQMHQGFSPTERQYIVQQSPFFPNEAILIVKASTGSIVLLNEASSGRSALRVINKDTSPQSVFSKCWWFQKGIITWGLIRIGRRPARGGHILSHV